MLQGYGRLMQQTIERVHLTVAGVTHHLSPLEDAGDLKSAVLHAVRTGGDFVEVSLDAGQRLSFLITATTPVVIAVETVVIATETADRTAETWRPEFDVTTEGETPYDLL
ncbi:hypothetical protein AVW09_00715 [Microbacterium sp. T32]|nr:hypothetical protein AVW09_00715 [Microbacterium sp. T32]